MKKIILSFLLLTGLTAVKVNAQMAAAQKVAWDINKVAIIGMPQDDVWEILNQPELLQKASGGYVTSIVIKDANFPVVREVTLSDGTKRTETVKQLEKQHKFMVIGLDTETLPKGVKEAEIAIFTKDKDDKCEITWRALIKGNAESKKAMKEKLETEFNAYTLGFEKLIKNSVPAASMN